MTNGTDQAILAKVAERARAQIIMLAVEVLLGMAVNLIGVPDEVSGTSKTASTILLVLHGLVGLGLLIGAFLGVRLGQKAGPAFARKMWIGAGLVVLTFATGLATMATKNNWWSYAMTVGFIASLLFYGALYVKEKTAR